jgi:hypothetical protein
MKKDVGSPTCRLCRLCLRSKRETESKRERFARKLRLLHLISEHPLALDSSLWESEQVESARLFLEKRARSEAREQRATAGLVTIVHTRAARIQTDDRAQQAFIPHLTCPGSCV